MPTPASQESAVTFSGAAQWKPLIQKDMLRQKPFSGLQGRTHLSGIYDASIRVVTEKFIRCEIIVLGVNL
jgi:hypothetical protein